MCIHTIPSCGPGVKLAKYGVIVLVTNWRTVTKGSRHYLFSITCHGRVAWCCWIFLFFKRYQKSGLFCEVYHFLRSYVSQTKHISRLKWALLVDSAPEANRGSVVKWSLHLGPASLLCEALGKSLNLLKWPFPYM